VSKLKPPKKAPQKSIEERLEELARIEYRKKVDADIYTIGAVGTLKKQWELEEAEKLWAEEAAADTRRPGIFNAGDRVEFTAKHIQQTSAGLGQSKVFTIQECSCDLCALGNHVCTTDMASFYPGFRHIHKSVIRHRGSMHVDDVPMGLQKLVSIPRAGNTRWLNRADRKALGLDGDE
jgi:hypothetical protein